MLKKYLFTGLFIVISAAFPLGAASVSFLVIETGPTGGVPRTPYSILWENSLMDVFYESGHIVSNAPIMRMSAKPADGFPNEAERDYNDAKKGGMEFFIVAILEHPESAVSMRLFNTESRKLQR